MLKALLNYKQIYSTFATQLNMALNLKTLGTRSLSGAVFVAVLLGAILWNYYSFAFLFFVVSMLGLNEFFKISEILQAKPYKTAAYALAVILYALSLHFSFFIGRFSVLSFLFYPFLLLIPFILMAVAMLSKREQPIQNYLFTLFGLLYAVIPFCLLHDLVNLRYGLTPSDAFYNPKPLLAIIFLIWCNDTFAYLGGSLFGKHKMIPRVSPGKTWEGTLFGIAVSVALAYLIRNTMFDGSGYLWPVMGLLVPVLATVGDLVESMLKRQAGIKDSGNLMPGHGGVLDRFDSLIFVSPFALVILNML